MDVPVADVPVGRFFATADSPPDNVYYLCAHGRVRRPRMIKSDGRIRYIDGKFASKELAGENVSLCQNINTGHYWYIRNDLLVRLIREDEHDKTIFHAA